MVQLYAIGAVGKGKLDPLACQPALFLSHDYFIGVYIN